MFALFERFLTPTAAPEHPEPPAGLIAFLWHFARQAKWLFAALFVVELFVALTDSAVPWFMGRVVTMVTKTPPDRFLADGWPWLLGMAVVVLIVRPAVTLTRYLITNQAIAAPFTGLIRWQSHWHVVRQSWAFFQNDFAGRISNRVMQTGPSVRSTLTATITTVWYILVYGASAIALTAAADRWLAVPILLWFSGYAALLLLFRAAHARALEMSSDSALDADGAHRRQLHQHPHREAVRPRQRRGPICAQRGRPPRRSVSRFAAPAHRLRRDARRAQRAADRRIGRAGAGAVALRRGRGRRHRHGAAADAAAHQHVAPDRHAHHRDFRGSRRGAGRHADDRAAAATARSGRRPAADGARRPHRFQERAVSATAARSACCRIST